MPRTFLIALAAMLSSAAAPLRAETPVPIEEEPQHRLRFHNAHVRFFDVELPPRYRGVMHIHHHDGVFVNITPSTTEAQDWGAEPVTRPPRTPGESYFIGYAQTPKAHRISNVGAQPYRVTDTEILAGCGPADIPDDALSGSLIVENKRVRVTRIELDPRAKATLFGPCGMLVAVTGGALVIQQPGGDEHVSLGPAGFKWREGAQPVVIENVGSEPIHLVDILIKQ